MLYSEKTSIPLAKRKIIARLRSRRILEKSAARLDEDIEDHEIQMIMEHMEHRYEEGRASAAPKLAIKNNEKLQES